MARPAIFPGKNLDDPVKAYLTPTGKRRMEVVRRWLSRMSGWAADEIKSSDVVEAALRGEPATTEFLRKTKQLKTRTP